MSRSSSSPIIYFEESGLDFYFFLFNYEFSVKNLVNQWRIVSTDSRPDVILLRGGAAAPTTEIFVSRTGCCSLHAAKILGALVSKLVNGETRGCDGNFVRYFSTTVRNDRSLLHSKTFLPSTKFMH